MYLRTSLIALFLLCILVTTPAHANWIGNVQFDFESPSHLAHATRVDVSFDYAVTEPEGLMLQAYPFCPEDTYPDFSWSGSPILTGTGTQTVWFKLNTGSLDITRVKLRSWNAVTSDPVLELDLPVHFIFADHGVYGFEMSHSQPSWLAHGEDLMIHCDTYVDLVGGGRVEMLPYSGGSPLPGYTVPAPELVPIGYGTANQTISYAADAEIDEIRVRLTNAGETVIVQEFRIPADYSWRAHGMSNLELDLPSPAYLPFNLHVIAAFDFHTAYPGDTRMFVRGAYDGAALDPQIFEGSAPVPASSGHITRWFTIPGSSPVEANMLRLQMSESGGPLLFDEFVPAEYHFADHAVYGIQFTPSSTAILDRDTNVDVIFDYSTTWPTGALVFLYPYSGESQIGSFASGSPTYPTGSGSGTYLFRAIGADVLVDRVKFRMENAERDQVLLEFFVDTKFYFGNTFRSTDVPTVPSRRILLEQNSPNPFNPGTEIRFSLPEEMPAFLAVYDLRGRFVARLWQGHAPAGTTTAHWNGTDAEGRSVASGVYIVRLEAGGMDSSRRMVLVR